MSQNWGETHFQLGHPSYHNYICAPLSKLPSCAPALDRYIRAELLGFWLIANSALKWFCWKKATLWTSGHWWKSHNQERVTHIIKRWNVVAKSPACLSLNFVCLLVRFSITGKFYINLNAKQIIRRSQKFKQSRKPVCHSLFVFIMSSLLIYSQICFVIVGQSKIVASPCTSPLYSCTLFRKSFWEKEQ